MRKKQYLTKPNYAIKEYKVEDYSKITDYFANVEVDNAVCANPVTLQYFCSQVGTMLKSYFVANRVFAYMKDKYLYEIKNYRFNLILSKITQPLLIDVVINGKKEILVIEDKSCYVLQKNITFNFPFGTSIAKYDGRLFVANEKNIYYSNVFNFSGNSTNIENVGFLSIDAEDEKILELICFNDCLYVVCKKAIYKLTITNEQFKFEKCEINYVDIL